MIVVNGQNETSHLSRCSQVIVIEDEGVRLVNVHESQLGLEGGQRVRLITQRSEIEPRQSQNLSW